MSEQQTENPLRDAISEAIRDNEVILFMKGTPEMPACGFSARTVAALQSTAEVEDWTGGGDHFRATVVSPAFAGLSRIQQHRLVMDLFAGEIGGSIHALSVKTQTP